MGLEEFRMAGAGGLNALVFHFGFSIPLYAAKPETALG